jgi:hypothetical protein
VFAVHFHATGHNKNSPEIRLAETAERNKVCNGLARPFGKIFKF